MTNKDKRFIQDLLAGNSSIQEVYTKYKHDFLLYALRYYSIDEETGTEIYQEAFIRLYENIRSGKFKDTNVSIKTYLFSIGKNLIRKHWTGAAKDEAMKSDLSDEWILQYIDESEWKQAQEVASEVVAAAGDICAKILKWIFWENKKMTDIVQLMNYSSVQVAKNRKGICIKKITIEIKRRLEELGIHLKTQRHDEV